MQDNQRQPQQPPEDEPNPYESPRAVVPRTPLPARLIRATRRAAATYWAEIRRAKVSPLDHLGSWFLLAFIVLTVGMAALRAVITLVLRIL